MWFILIFWVKHVSYIISFDHILKRYKDNLGQDNTLRGTKNILDNPQFDLNSFGTVATGGLGGKFPCFQHDSVYVVSTPSHVSFGVAPCPTPPPPFFFCYMKRVPVLYMHTWFKSKNSFSDLFRVLNFNFNPRCSWLCIPVSWPSGLTQIPMFV